MIDKSVIITAHRALALPEIVGEILVWLGNGPIHWLLHCALVNKTWFHEAIRRLWSDLEAHGIFLEEGMMGISPDRRQMYANLVKIASVATYLQETEPVVQPALESVVFPQLHTSYLVLAFHGSGTDKCIRIPALNMPSLQTLHVEYAAAFNMPDMIKYAAGPRYLYPDQWDYLVDQIPKLFPRLVNFQVVIPAILYIAGFETLSKSEGDTVSENSDNEDLNEEDSDDQDLDRDLDDQDADDEDTDEEGTTYTYTVNADER
ncbi:hypothetical protein N7519_003194 [Penicillium mononematosum]|uniref:uncharacterized protein n=1 Tax=Penicillium mononematosum TaxID=268346 RepID=UPI002548283B|nr:uncharacterized protein N7519_003194 [Penicillium mononematosum]KAJ6188286.1 hypothetical protein N7519_003194 [Penicillium mononematosum]